MSNSFSMYNNGKRISFRYNDKGELTSTRVSARVKSGADYFTVAKTIKNKKKKK